MKTCSKCKVSLPTYAFPKNRASRDGLNNQCKSCQKAYAQIRRARLKEINTQLGDRIYELTPIKKCYVCKLVLPSTAFNVALARKDGLNGMCKACTREIKAAWNVNNKDRKAATDAAWKQANPEKVRASHRERRAKKRNAFVEYVDETLLLERQDYQCYWCLRDIDTSGGQHSPLYPNLEHIIPIHLNGEHSYANCVMSCRSCNNQKSASPLEVWLERLHGQPLDLFIETKP